MSCCYYRANVCCASSNKTISKLNEMKMSLERRKNGGKDSSNDSSDQYQCTNERTKRQPVSAREVWISNALCTRLRLHRNVHADSGLSVVLHAVVHHRLPRMNEWQKDSYIHAVCACECVYLCRFMLTVVNLMGNCISQSNWLSIAPFLFLFFEHMQQYRLNVEYIESIFQALTHFVSKLHLMCLQIVHSSYFE